MTDEEPRPVAFPSKGAKAPTAKGYRDTEYGGRLAEFLASGEEAILVGCDAISQHAMFMGLAHAAEDRRLPVKVSNRPDGVQLTRTSTKVDVPAPEPTQGDEKPQVEDVPQPQPEKPSLIGRMKSWGGKK